MQNEFEDYACSIGGCKNVPTHSLYRKEYYYCDEHYVIIGECNYCKTPIHESWDCSDTMCRPCGKDRSPCDKCGEPVLNDDVKYTEDGEGCCPSCFKEAEEEETESDDEEELEECVRCNVVLEADSRMDMDAEMCWECFLKKNEEDEQAALQKAIH